MDVPLVCAPAVLARMLERAGWFSTELVFVEPVAILLGCWYPVVREGTKIAVIVVVVVVVAVVVIVAVVIVAVVAVVVVVVLPRLSLRWVLR